MKLRTLLNENIHSFNNRMEKKYKLRTFYAEEFDKKIRLVSMLLAKEDRGKGTGSKVMEELCDYADRNKKKIELTPAVDGDYSGETTSQSRLIDFYKKFDFVLNKGRNKDFTISELMFRLPK